ncbi:hypothetical protein NDN08_007922 [Rhodosorus marinus]|uniref:Aldehyde dehydrogenase domain-containing protein n=1 Tax=Rhodosorus marinus TaxID=101924 RepID=A0AAV8UYW9_9RHOD|nr:hypothetical protein NDN08_007922 [Rhodosorus marinus]
MVTTTAGVMEQRVEGFPRHLLKDPSLLKTENFVGGEFVSGDSGSFAVFNPATNEEIARVSSFGKEETRKAIEAASLSFMSWKKSTPSNRSDVLRKWYEAINENAEDLSAIMTLEQGKPLAEALGEVRYGASYVDWFSGEAVRSSGGYMDLDNRRAMLIRQPVGVCAAITPWNFPVAMITRKAAAAIAAGCTFVVKPAEATPLTALALAELARRAGIPAGVFNVICGSNPKEIGLELSTNPSVKKITFTGSTNVGKILLEQSASTVKRACMELGGLAPLIVLEDADLKKAAVQTVANKTRNGGQTCISANRIFVHKSVADSFVSELEEIMKPMKVGNGVDSGVVVGPLINAAAVEKVKSHVDDAVSKGAEVVLGGKHLTELGENFYAPTILKNVSMDSLFCCEETFGPVLAVIPFENEDEIIERANDTDFGLASYVFTESLSKAMRIGEALESGMVGINSTALSDARAPFGGIKQSGMGTEGGPTGIHEYQNLKYVCFAADS